MIPMVALAVPAWKGWARIVSAAAFCGVLAGCVPEPAAVSAQCPPEVCDPAPSFVYARVSIAGIQFIQAFTVHPETGALTPAGAPVPAAFDDSPQFLQLAVSPDGTYLIAAKRFPPPATLESFAIEAGGTLVLADAVTQERGFRRVEFSPDGTRVYSIDLTQPLPPGTGLMEFSLNGDGALAATDSIALPMNGLAVHPDGEFVIAASPTDGVRIVRALSGGGLQDSGVTFTLGVGNSPQLAMDPLGKFVDAFVGGVIPPKMGLLRFNPAGPALTLLNPPVMDLPCGSNHATGTFDPTGQFVYVVCTDGPRNLIYRLDGRNSTPVLTLVDDLSFPPLVHQNEFSAAIPRSGKLLYSTALTRTVIDDFSIDPATGILSPLPDAPFDVTGFADFLEGPLAAH